MILLKHGLHVPEAVLSSCECLHAVAIPPNANCLGSLLKGTTLPERINHVIFMKPAMWLHITQ